MTHFRSMFDTKAIGVWDLDGRDRIVTIASVKPGTVEGEKGRKSKKAMIVLREFELPFVCNVTNAKTIAGLYGPDTKTWGGKRITLYPTTTQFGGDTVDCIRVRPTIPRGEPDHGGGRPVDPDVRDRQQSAARAAAHPATPIGAATTAEELLAALAECAAWVSANHEKAWPRVLERCAELGVAEERAVEAIATAVS